MPILKKTIYISIGAIIIGLTLLIGAYFSVFSSNPKEPVDIVVTKGMTVNDIAVELKEQELISSVNLFKVFIKLNNGSIAAGTYRFENFESVNKTAYRFTHQQFGVVQNQVVIPEGFNEYQIAYALKENDPAFDDQEFLRIVTARQFGEGYLFPDTYQIMPGTSPKEVVELLTKTFDQKTEALRKEAEQLGLVWDDTIILASLIEGEANNDKDRALVSSVFHNRLKAGIALQSDVPFKKINGKTSKELTLKDLKIESIFNTYTTPGLPPKPLNNPGLASIKAAIRPATSAYLYFLTGDDGITRFSNTLEEHARLKNLYIK